MQFPRVLIFPTKYTESTKFKDSEQRYLFVGAALEAGEFEAGPRSAAAVELAVDGRGREPLLRRHDHEPERLGFRQPRDVLARPAVTALRRTLEVDDPAVLDNLDRPEDLARLP